MSTRSARASAANHTATRADDWSFSQSLRRSLRSPRSRKSFAGAQELGPIHCSVFVHEPGPMADDTLARFHEFGELPDSLPSSFAQPSSAPSASSQMQMPPPAVLPPARRLLRCRTTEIDRDSECSTTEAEHDDETPIFDFCAKRQRQ